MLRAKAVLFGFRGGPPVLDGIDLAIGAGEIVGLGGPSGGGKSTLGRILAGHLRPQAGEVSIEGTSVVAGAGAVRPVQYLFQSPEFAVNPRWRVRRILTEAWTPDETALARFGLSGVPLDAYPHELSGGELQRVNILRALAPGVRFLVADEITAMLDPITQTQIWRALLATAAERGLGMLVVSHDAALLERLSSRTLVLRDGRLS